MRARDGTRVWRFPAGKYANPVVADEDRIYVTGRAHEFALARKGSKVVKEYLRARAASGASRAQSALNAAEKRRREITSRSTSREASGSPLT